MFYAMYCVRMLTDHEEERLLRMEADIAHARDLSQPNVPPEVEHEEEELRKRQLEFRKVQLDEVFKGDEAELGVDEHGADEHEADGHGVEHGVDDGGAYDYGNDDYSKIDI